MMNIVSIPSPKAIAGLNFSLLDSSSALSGSHWNKVGRLAIDWRWKKSIQLKSKNESYFCNSREFKRFFTLCPCQARNNDSESLESSSPEDSDEELEDSISSCNLNNWRTFRAHLVATEQTKKGSDSLYLESESEKKSESRRENSNLTFIDRRWAHSIAAPEKGCLLVASPLLDGTRIFERSVILLLDGGEDGGDPYGVILNKKHPLLFGHLSRIPPKQAEVFSTCQVYVGGPLSDRHFTVLHGMDEAVGCESVFTGVNSGGIDCFNSAVDLVRNGTARPDDFRFVVGYSGWNKLQLLNEVRAGWWYPAACSAECVLSNPNQEFWREILLLMGGSYAKIARTAS